MFEELKKLTETSVQNVLSMFQQDSPPEIRVLPMVFFNFFRPEKAYTGKEFEEGLATGKVGWFIEGKILAGDSRAMLYYLIPRGVRTRTRGVSFSEGAGT